VRWGIKCGTFLFVVVVYRHHHLPPPFPLLLCKRDDTPAARSACLASERREGKEGEGGEALIRVR
jgi:hypothetical protein